ncbi:MAG: DUF3244 domain-containing protein [Tannerellaceae bacterium]|jgi:hypothetical protein|nr:DUF3244 domain-containing protein [Tannerellaceae bacterium]
MTKIFFVAALAGLLISATAFGQIVHVHGRWGEHTCNKKGIYRSFISFPAHPEASINDKILTLLFADAISELLVTIADENGAVAYQEVFSGEPGAMISIPLELSAGTYQLIFSHERYGLLVDSFEIE